MPKKNEKSKGSENKAAEANDNAAKQPVENQQDTGDHGQSQAATAPVSEAEATAQEPTKTVPAGSADATADTTADSPSNDTVNTHPQSPLHKGDLSDKDQKAIVDEFNQPGAQVLAIAEKYGVTSERVFEVVNDANGVAEEDR